MSYQAAMEAQKLAKLVCESEKVVNTTNRIAGDVAGASAAAVTGNPAAGVAAKAAVHVASAKAPQEVAEFATGLAITTVGSVAAPVVLGGLAIDAGVKKIKELLS